MKAAVVLLLALVPSAVLCTIWERTIIANHDVARLPTASRQRRLVDPCGDNCEFRLCNTDGENVDVLRQSSFTILNAPRIVTNPFICKTGQGVGLVLRSGEASVVQGSKVVAISRWQPRGLRTRFGARFIQALRIPFLERSGIGRVAASTNQWSVLHDRCMVLPIRRYQVLERNGELREVRNTTRRNACVSFRTTAPAIQVSLLWDTADDLDLEITEPDGEVLTFRNRRSASGKLNADNNVGKCEAMVIGGRENVLYFPDAPIEDGRYFVRVRHFRKCRPGDVKYVLRVVINGRVRTIKSGVTAEAGMRLVDSVAFSWP